MNIRTQTFQKCGLAFIVAAFAMVGFVSTASAESYYQPVALPYYQYQQPVYYYQYQNYQTQYQHQLQMLQQLQSLQQQLNTLLRQYQQKYGQSYNSTKIHYNWGINDDYDIDVETLYARDIDDEEATLYGDVDVDDAPYVDVWFEYGEGGDLDEETRDKRVYDDGRFSIDIDDLDDDERYYFRAVAEDPNGDRSYGQIMSFEADGHSSSDDDEPDVETLSASNIEEHSAEIEGEVDMNDYDDGDVFFVWGEDESLVEDVEDEDSYGDIDEEGDDLQKYRVYTNLDGYRTFWLEIYGLDQNQDHYYRICVEYEDDDNDDTLMCGDVEHFETD